MANLHKIESKNAPAAVGPYSHAIRAGEFVFCSGQIGLNPETGILVEGGVEKEAEQVLQNLTEVLKEVKLSLKDVVKTEIFLTDINDFGKVNEIYARYFTADPKPARQTVGVASLPKGVRIEISCIAYAKK